MKAATINTFILSNGNIISIHAAREGGDLGDVYYNPETDISIHAAREGGDAVNNRNAAYSPISIHAAREGGDTVCRHGSCARLFQSTPPVKAATMPPMTATRFATISIHAAREGGDDDNRPTRQGCCHFNPRRP